LEDGVSLETEYSEAPSSFSVPVQVGSSVTGGVSINKNNDLPGLSSVEVNKTASRQDGPLPDHNKSLPLDTDAGAAVIGDRNRLHQGLGLDRDQLTKAGGMSLNVENPAAQLFYSPQYHQQTRGMPPMNGLPHMGGASLPPHGAFPPYSMPPPNMNMQVMQPLPGLSSGMMSYQYPPYPLAMNDLPPPLRRGKWTYEEEAYAKEIIDGFNDGSLMASPGTTLRASLSERLHCDPMRITKKYSGDSCLGKRVFVPTNEQLSSVVVSKREKQAAAELAWKNKVRAVDAHNQTKAAAQHAQYWQSPPMGQFPGVPPFTHNPPPGMLVNYPPFPNHLPMNSNSPMVQMVNMRQPDVQLSRTLIGRGGGLPAKQDADLRAFLLRQQQQQSQQQQIHHQQMQHFQYLHHHQQLMNQQYLDAMVSCEMGALPPPAGGSSEIPPDFAAKRGVEEVTNTESSPESKLVKTEPVTTGSILEARPSADDTALLANMCNWPAGDRQTEADL
jgi:hypothetical protein